jgi:hypothetical protein
VEEVVHIARCFGSSVRFHPGAHGMNVKRSALAKNAR